MEAQPKKNNTLWWVLGGCGCAVILAVLAIIISFLVIVYKTKPSQGQSASPTPNPKTSSSTSSQTAPSLSKDELIDYFVEEVTTYAGVTIPMAVTRWNKPSVTVSLENEGPDYSKRVFNEFIDKFNKNSETVKLSLAEKGGDIKVTFYPTVPSSGGGNAGPSSGADAIIDSAQIGLANSEVANYEDLSRIFDHEMMHALGFTGHFKGNKCVLMSWMPCKGVMTANEEKLIWMMYSSGIPLNSDETQIRQFIQNWNPK